MSKLLVLVTLIASACAPVYFPPGRAYGPRMRVYAPRPRVVVLAPAPHIRVW